MPERASWRAETGKPVELVHDYAAFYKSAKSLQKYVDALGIPVFSLAKAPDAALLFMRDIIDSVLATRFDLLALMIRRDWTGDLRIGRAVVLLLQRW